jgi:hypothetical protein
MKSAKLNPLAGRSGVPVSPAGRLRSSLNLLLLVLLPITTGAQ